MSEKIHLTAALPTWENRNIIWLQLESLCRQKTDLNWELIVCEEQTPARRVFDMEEGTVVMKPTMLGEKDLMDWEPRLREAGCKRIKYIPLGKREPLSKKWWIIGQEAKGDTYALCAADDYSSPDRFELSHSKIDEGYDWFNVKKGIFLNIQTWDSATFIAENEKRGLTMACNTKKIKNIIGNYWPTYSVDGWLQQKMSRFYSHPEPVLGLDTDGANKICGNRAGMYAHGFYQLTQSNGMLISNFVSPQQKVEDILPEPVLKRLKDERDEICSLVTNYIN
tara:strand:- start:2179 stop:3018 length:840 start_codon:yes stop_codon:yes gene_type:complete